MEIAPFIHSRTFYCDFNQNFAVRPNDLNVQWAMDKILPAMRDVDILNGVRRVVASDGKLCIAGVACTFRYFVENYLSSDERDETSNYLRDEHGREVKIFLGYAFKGNGVPDVSDSKLWQMFKKFLAPEWNRQTAETVIAPYESCAVKSVAGKNLDQKFYPTNTRGDVEIFEQCLAARKDFCSNVDAIKIFEDGEYEIITASQSVINRLQSDAQKKNGSSPKPPQQNARTILSSSSHTKLETSLRIGQQSDYSDNRRDNNRNSDGVVPRDELKPPRTFKSINDLCDDINRNYSGAEVDKIHNDNYRVKVGNNDGKYRVTEVGTGTIGVILEKLNGFLSKRDVKIIFLIAEETDGR